jgi:sulfur transfer protein SufE
MQSCNDADDEVPLEVLFSVRILNNGKVQRHFQFYSDSNAQECEINGCQSLIYLNGSSITESASALAAESASLTAT